MTKTAKSKEREQINKLADTACSACESDDRNECKCPQDCCVCGTSLHLPERDCEWPSGKLYCWGCAHERIAELERQ